ncbi:hypothetical protein [Pandoraea sp. NPDC087047]|uniref:hypothetical protein n=1 Tax=Pandoraea sp. NPDC087047 TaxID=3364390 RepID=UPI003823614B
MLNTAPESQPTRQSHGLWPVAFAVLLVANLATHAGSAVPKRSMNRTGDDGDMSGTHAAGAGVPNGSSGEYALALPMGQRTSDDVAIAPVALGPIKLEYSLTEFLDALASSRNPFRHTGDALLQMYTLVTGEVVQTHTRKSVDQWTDALDFATGLIPDVGMTRMPGEAAGLVLDQIEGRRPDSEQIFGMAQGSVPRNFGSQGIVRTRPDFSEVRQPIRPKAPVRGQGGDGVAPGPNALAEPVSDTSSEARPQPAGTGHELHAERVADIEPPVDDGGGVPEATHFANADAPAGPETLRIENEHEHLQGYEQSLSPDQLPPGPRPRLVFVDGFRYLAGEAGYYRATRGHSLDHWIISAPRGAKQQAPVPVHFDAATGKWHAEKPLRICGGGCGPSREATPHSISMDREKVWDAVRHLPDERIREGIRFAFNDLSSLHLTRSNRPDLHMMRDNSIVDHRASLRASMKRIKRNAPLLKQQIEASLVTTMHYYWNQRAEAFCQENSEILFHYLIANDIPTSRIRMITVKPKNRPPHVLVLYTESEKLISMLESATRWRWWRRLTAHSRISVITPAMLTRCRSPVRSVFAGAAPSVWPVPVVAPVVAAAAVGRAAAAAREAAAQEAWEMRAPPAQAPSLLFERRSTVLDVTPQPTSPWEIPICL